MKHFQKIKLMLLMVLIMLSCQPEIITDKSLNNLDYNSIIEKKGQPDEETSLIFNKSKSLFEYQSNLYDLLKNNDSIEVKELKWKNGDMVTVIWLINKEGNLISIDNIKWNDKKIKM